MMFYKIHYQLVAINMPLEPQELKSENSVAYVILTSSRDYHLCICTHSVLELYVNEITYRKAQSCLALLKLSEVH